MGMPVISTSGITRLEAITDIIASVALEEAAIAHILNAEGEKLQRVIADENITAEELLKFNESVQSMVGTISELEKILQSKLGLFANCICTDEEETKEEVVEEETKEEVVEAEVKEEIVKEEAEVTA